MRQSQRTLLLLAPLALLAAGCKSSTREAAPVVAATQPTPAPFAGEVGMGISYLQTRAADLVDAVDTMLGAIQSQNLEAAKRAYHEARAPYEEIEVMAMTFPELHQAIDGRAWEFEGGELSSDFRGFHRIETYLFARKNTENAIPYAKQLLEDVEDLQAVLTERQRFDAATSFRSMIARCDELASRTISGEEEMWSGQTLLAIRHGWIGVHSQYRHFAGDVRAADVKLAERLDRGYRKAMELIAQDFAMGETSAAPYGVVDLARRREIADATIRLRMYVAKAQQVLELVPES